MDHSCMSDSNPAGLLSVRDAAAALGVSPITIRRRISDGTLHVYRLGTSAKAPIRIGQADLAAFVTESTRAHEHMERGTTR